MNRRMLVRAAAVLCAAFLLSGCYKRETIYGEGGGYVVRFDPDYESVLYMLPSGIERLQLSLYDMATEKEVYRTYMGVEGGHLSAVRPGRYRVAVWSLGSEYTTVTYTTQYNLLTAETKTVQETPVRVIVAPDHVFAYSGEIDIPYITDADGEMVFTMPLRSVIDTWRIEVEGVKGLENFSDASVFVYNQVRELYFKDWKRSGVAVDRAMGGVGGDLVVSEFGTFGMPDDDRVTVVVRILAQNGYVHEKTVDVTDQVRDPGNARHVIRIDFDTELRPLEQGGLAPTAEKWNEHVDAIDLI